ncbi:ATP synthase F1 subunit gamma [Albibacterium indicum]|uniref:ATP synthase F1 subunit gamma n=1 Tax=Albibacterium indicum TaxID=2292082 RepID=UPI000E511315|nr:ATP synthase F1 subunit gamma [Pedobacter indicus]
MANLKEVRNRISSVTSTQQITNAMKMVSAAKLKRATNAIVDLRPYATKLKEILSNLSASIEGNASPYLDNRSPEKVLLIVVTSNRGLAGAFNSSIIKATNLLISQKYSEQHKKGNVSILAIGKRGHDHFAKANYAMIGNHTELFSQLNFENTSIITEEVMKGFVEGDYDRVEIVYNQFKNAAVQILTTEQLLPLEPAVREEDETQTEVDYIFEPSKAKITEDLIPKSIKIQLYKAVLDSHASEHGARMTAMDKATENAGELLKALKLSYNQARQAAITTELTEIVSGAAALSEG